jgi:hypothetical protein
VEHGLVPQPGACGGQPLPGEALAAALAVGPQAPLGLPDRCGPGVRRAGMAVRQWVPVRCARLLGCFCGGGGHTHTHTFALNKSGIAYQDKTRQPEAVVGHLVNPTDSPG